MCIFCELGQDPKEYKGASGLDCSGCPRLTEIPYISSLTDLICQDCPNLHTIPSLPKLITLDCSSCPKLSRIPDLPKLQVLDCSEYPHLSIGSLPKVELIVYNNRSLVIEYPPIWEWEPKEYLSDLLQRAGYNNEADYEANYEEEDDDDELN